MIPYGSSTRGGCPPSLTLQKVLSDAEHRKTSPAETDFVPSKLPGMEATEKCKYAVDPAL